MSLIERWKNGDYAIPQSSELLAEVIQRMDGRGELTKTRIKKDFSLLIEEIEQKISDTYFEHEEKTAKRFLRDYFSQRRGDAIADEYDGLSELFMSIFQSRKTRAGKAFEDMLKTLFRRLDYPFAEQQVINGKPDFIIPSREHYDRLPLDCVIFTSKRTLRERWRQITTEGTRGLGFYLATIDGSITEAQLREMKSNRIYLVVPSRLKTEKYSGADNVITFERFFEDVLDDKMRKWKRDGVIQVH